MVQSRPAGGRRSILAALVTSALMAGLLITVTPRPAEALVTAVKGSACGYFTNVGLFGGPQTLKGCGSAAPSTDPSWSPFVSLPPTGSASPITQTDPDGAAGVYGPATIFGGRWPCDPGNCIAIAPPSGPITATTQGTPAGGTVTSSADIDLHPSPIPVRCDGDPVGTTNCLAPGGFGPWPVEGDSLHVECTASETAVTGSTTFVNAALATSTDSEGEPLDIEPIPDNPPVNYTRSGVITNVGDVFTVVFNQHIINSDGSLTVNAVHMYLFGPTAIGEMVKGQATCGTTPSPLTPTDTVKPTCSTPVVMPVSPDDPTPQIPRRELVGVFDAGNGNTGGLNQIANIQATNATVDVGVPGGAPYQQFNPPQRGPLQIMATRQNESLPMSWSFDAVDVAGNTTHCVGVAYLGAQLSINDFALFEGNSGTTAATFLINRSGDVGGTSTVSYRTNGGNATAGTDYTAVPLTSVTFAPGETTKPATVNLTGDGLSEGNETVNMVLSSPTGATIADTTGVATILNDDGTALLGVGDVSLGEGNAGTTVATFTVNRSGNTTGASTVSYATGGGTATAGTDYTAVPATTLSFAAGETTKTVTVNVTGDTAVEANETFNVSLSGATGATVADGTGTATIVNDDNGTAYLSVSDVSVNEGNAGTAAATFTVTRSGNTSPAVSVKYKTSGGTATAGTDYTALPLTTLNFAAGETAKTVTVNLTGDTLAEANETFNLSLSSATGATISDTAGVGTILNDDGAAYLTVTDLSVNEGNSGTTAATFTVRRSGNTSGTSSVKYQTGGGTATAGSDYTALPLTTLGFAAGETTKTVNVSVTGDTVDEVNETFVLTLSAATGATLSDAAGTATVVDDEGTVTPGPATFLSVNDLSLTEGNAGVATATFTVTRSGVTSGPSTVKYRTSGGSATAGVDYTALPLTTLSFGAGETAKTVTVNVAGDTLAEATETFNLTLSAPTDATISDTAGAASILDDDGAAFVSVNDLFVVEGHSGTTAATFAISRSGNTTGPSTVKYATGTGTAAAGADYTAVALTDLSFAAGETTKTVTVDVTGDGSNEPNETFPLTLSAPTGAVITDTAGTATIINDDGTYLSVNDLFVIEGNSGSTAATFTVTRSGDTTGSSTVSYTTTAGSAASGTDFTAVPLTPLSFAAGETTKSVTVNVTGDVLTEGDETFNLVLSSPAGATVSDTTGVATILNNDGTAYLSVGNIAVNEGTSGVTSNTGPAKFTITRSGNLSGSSTVSYTTTAGTASAGTDYTSVALTSVTFAPGEQTKSVFVNIAGDAVDEPNETFNLVLSGATGATLGDATGVATILDDD